jgi:MFS family permease
MHDPEHRLESAVPREGAVSAAEAAATGDGEVGTTLYRFVCWNFSVIVLDVAFWTAGIACVDVSAVLPVFVSTLTSSKLVIALLGVLPGVGWTLPQLVGAARIMHRPRKKGYLLSVAAVGRTPMLILPVLLLFFPGAGKAVMLSAVLGCYAVLFLTDGLIGAAWYDIIAKTIPPRTRGRFFAGFSVLGGVGALGSGWLVKRVLASPHLMYPRQYGVLFVFLCAGLFLSLLLLSFIREPEGEVASERPRPLRDMIRQIPRIWRSSSHLRRLLVVTWLGMLSSLGWPFYVLHGMNALHLSAEAGAVFIWATTAGSVIGSLGFAWLNDRRGPRPVVVGVSATRPMAPALAVLVPLLIRLTPQFGSPESAQYIYASVFFFGGAMMTGGWMGFANYLLELAPGRERPLYVGMGNTLNAPGLMAPMIGGWLASVWSYEGTFALGAVLGIAGLVASFFLEEPKCTERTGEAAPARPEQDRYHTTANGDQ